MTSNAQISPAQIESVLVKHSRIADAAVIGIPNEETGKMLKAFVVKADPTLSKEEVTKYIEGMLYFVVWCLVRLFYRFTRVKNNIL